MESSSVEYLVSILNKPGFYPVLTDEEIEKAKEIEKKALIGMSIKSGLHERKWIFETTSGEDYFPHPDEIEGLAETAEEHYEELFGICNCDFVMIRREEETDQASCFNCNKKVKEN